MAGALPREGHQKWIKWTIWSSSSRARLSTHAHLELAAFADRIDSWEIKIPISKSILQQRGVLSPEEIHRLASKTKKGMQADDGQAACHSDVADSDRAQVLQLVELGLEDNQV